MQKIKNIAIIAHVDHGKTTLVDQLLRKSGTFRDNQHVDERVMDSNDLEKERGITILAKTTSITYNDYRINIMDTPGHSDFGGEVERILGMVDGVLLVVDAFEGVMPQTRFVLQKSLQKGLHPIVVVNKIDRPNARPEEVLDEVLDLLIDLGADEEQLEFPVVYASALQGTSGMDYQNLSNDMEAVFTSIIEHVEDSKGDPEAPFVCQVSLLDYNDYLGRIGIGRIFEGTVRMGDTVQALTKDGVRKQFKIQKLISFHGITKVDVDQASAGEIVGIAGYPEVTVGDTVADVSVTQALPEIVIDEPTLKMNFLVNTSPFAGQEGKYLTSRNIEERLFQELRTDVSLRVEKTNSPDKWIVSGRGELHLSILLETMRREGYELQVTKPEVIIRLIDGKPYEPVEEVLVTVPKDYEGKVIETMGNRRAEIQSMHVNEAGESSILFHAYSRGLIGYTSEFITITKGYGIMNKSFLEYRPKLSGELGGRRNGVLVSMEGGTARAYGIQKLEDRGEIFIEPGTDVYEGMIVGENARVQDLPVNIVKTKQLTNVRSANKDSTVVLKRPIIFTLEQALEYINEDELVEITPENIRMRKAILDANQRNKERKRKNYETEEL